MGTKKIGIAYLLLATFPGSHRWYLRKKGWWYFLAIASISFIGLLNGFAMVFYIGLMAYMVLFAWDVYLVPKWTKGGN